MSRKPESIGQKIVGIVLFIVLLPIIVPLAILALCVFILNRGVMYVLVWAWWCPRGKDVFFISSDSTIWKEYMDREVFPLVAERAVALNWSDRLKWPRFSLAVHVFRTFRHRREFTPMVIVFRPFRGAQIFRFWHAFQDRKHGRPASLEQLHHELTRALQ